MHNVPCTLPSVSKKFCSHRAVEKIRVKPRACHMPPMKRLGLASPLLSFRAQGSTFCSWVLCSSPSLLMLVAHACTSSLTSMVDERLSAVLSTLPARWGFTFCPSKRSAQRSQIISAKRGHVSLANSLARRIHTLTRTLD